MKVLQKGRPQKNWAKEYICTGNGNKGGGCGAKLLVEFEDLFLTYHTECGEHKEIFLTFKCSECGVLTNLDLSAAPQFELIPDQSVWEERQKHRTLSCILHG